MINYIEKFYGKKYLDTLRKMPDPKNGISYFLVGNSESAKIRQTEFNKYLRLAFRHNVINNDLKKRLSSKKWDTFFQVSRELMCAYFIEEILGYKIIFYPKGAKNFIGEYLLKYSSDESIFVEVKSPIRETPKGPWCGNDAEIIKRNVKKARKKMFRSNKKSIVILAPDLRFPISCDASGIEEALYGRDVFTIPIDTKTGSPIGETRLRFKPSGIFQPTVNTRISAVAILEDSIKDLYLTSCLIHVLSKKKIPIDVTLPKNAFEYIFKVYHNPYTINPIDRNVFKNWPQFVLDKKLNKMEWIDNK